MKSVRPLTQPVTVGIVGLGRAGWGLHLEPISNLPGFKITAVADPLADRCQEAADLLGCEQYSTIDELLANSDAQLIVVATPSFTHYEDALKVLKAGRHCIAEKPLALKSAEADELVSLARTKQLGLFVNHSYLHLAPYYHLKGVIESGRLGTLFSLRVCWASYARRWDWQTLKKNGGGQLNNTCPHVLSIVLPLLGSPVKKVFADLRNIKDAGDAEDHVHVVLQAESGITADITVSTAMALSGPRWALYGSRGSLTSDGQTSRIRYYDGSKVGALNVIDAAAPGRQYLSEQLPWEEAELQAEPSPVKPFHENILDALSGKALAIVTPESAAEVVRVTNLIQSAAGVELP
ncbi:MAG TPA: Gfo/Idh/MocA family oxidoreductase [Terrimicrobiaceae bacterium]|nr:Gfo/Idh/MocA family oxidoreductase [Terrimicrobiaceae bacterium]